MYIKVLTQSKVASTQAFPSNRKDVLGMSSPPSHQATTSQHYLHCRAHRASASPATWLMAMHIASPSSLQAALSGYPDC